ncbi:MAG: hypothetical protein Q4D60_06915 [Eubacteriales bacterium]|nr:hypothetical protein [Eubacteriales bacterium]
MNLTQINLLWEEYKQKYDIDKDVQISDVKYDADNYVEGCFHLLELLDGNYTLHLNTNVHLYSENYVKFILFHEFTHFYDFIHCPYEDKMKMIMWMNAYSEFHACRVTLARFIEALTLKMVHVDKIQLPGPYRETSIRHLLIESVYRTRICFEAFYRHYRLQDFGNGFRQLMYLFGYLSLFQNDRQLVEETLAALPIPADPFRELYVSLKAMKFDTVITLYQRITDEATLVYIKAMFRRFYPPQVLADEEIAQITLENYRDYIEKLDRRMKDMGLTPPQGEEDGTPIEAEAAFIKLYFLDS